MTNKQFKQRVPKLPDGKAKVTLEFHWLEVNIKVLDGIMSFWVYYN